MAINLNFTHKAEYGLHNNLIAEAISIYGVACKLIITLKQNIDFTVFGDWSNVKTNGTNIFDIYVLPSDQSDLERNEYQFSDFGLNYLYSNEVFISSKDLAKLGLNLEALYSALLVFPSNQVMEVTDVDFKVPGVNNLWAYTDLKSVIKLTLNSYQFKLHDDIEDKDMINTLENTGDSPEEIEESIEEQLQIFLLHLVVKAHQAVHGAMAVYYVIFRVAIVVGRQLSLQIEVCVLVVEPLKLVMQLAARLP